MPRPDLDKLCGGTEGNHSDVANSRQKNLVKNIRGPRYLAKVKFFNSRNSKAFYLFREYTATPA